MTSPIWLDGHRHDVIPLDELEAKAFDHALETGASTLHYPPTPRGWATTRIGGRRWAAWVEAPAEAAEAAS